ncbi:MAG: hypothetical protein JWM04_200 [Verrucomicrobiales bacterium]|jgi:two-component system NtrC family sensor kinase|nr:hypothetical protein [Verrucomicrobiales bacterium]
MRVSFQTKILLPVILILVLLMGITTWFVAHRLTDQIETEARTKLATAESVFSYFRDLHRENLIARYQNISNEPKVRAIAQLGDAPTTRSFFKEVLNEVQADAILFRSVRGGQTGPVLSVYRPKDLDEAQLETKSLEGAAHAIEKEEPNEITAPVGLHLYSVVSVPIIQNGSVTAVIAFVNEVGEKVALDLNKLTGIHVIFRSNERVLASTLKPAQLEQFKAKNIEQAPGSPSTTPSGKIVLDGEHFYWSSKTFAGSPANSVLLYDLLYSYEKPWLMLQETQRILLYIRFLGLGFALLILWILIRKVTKPLRDLRDGAEAVGRGDFTRRVAVKSNDEIGDLASSFNGMTESVKNSQSQLEQTVQTLQATRAQLVQSEKLSAIGEFVAGVAHELNNPLTAVIGFSQLLEQSGVDQKQQGFCQRVVQSAHRCHKIVHNLLSFARQHTPERKPADLSAIIESVVDILLYELRTSNIKLDLQLSRNLPKILADSHQLQQVFLNIINNARQAMEGRKGSTIKVITSVHGQTVTATFEDNGPGISPENLNKIFDPFFTTKPVGKGTGLGLSLSYGIVKEHGGQISARSTVGVGTSFDIDFPIPRETEMPGDGDAPKKARKFDGAGRKVLVIDDEESVLELVKELLSSHRYSVDIAENGQTALGLLAEKGPYDVIISDRKMPGLSGEQIYEQLLQTNPAAAERMIFMSADVISDMTQEFLRKYNKSCLSKPFSLDDFSTAIEQFLKKP